MWTEAAPVLEEKVRDGPQGETWRGRLPNGRPVEVRRVPGLDPAASMEQLETLKRLSGLPAPHLVPVVGGRVEAGDLWVVSEWQDGTTLDRLGESSRLTPGQATAAGLAVLSGLAELERASLGHGRVHGGNVHVTTGGQVRLADYALEPFPDPREARRTDLMAAGRLLCSALGVSTTGSESSVPGLAATAGALASGRLAGDAITARTLVADAAGLLGTPAALDSSHAQLGELASRLSDRPATPVPSRSERRRSPAPAPAAAPPRPRIVSTEEARRPYRPRPAGAAGFGGRWAVLAAGAAVLLLGLVGMVALLQRGGGSSSERGAVSGSPATAPAGGSAQPATPGPQPTGPPDYAPPAAGDVSSVLIRPTECGAGSQCSLTVEVHFHPPSSTEQVAWVFEVFNPCSGSSQELPGSSVSAQAGWNYVFGSSTVPVPPGSRVSVTAVTTSPARAASPPLVATGGGC